MTKLIHRGIRHEIRTTIQDPLGRREKAFADAWEEENKPHRHHFFSLPVSRLEALMVRDDKYVPISQETATAVATIIQWLASGVGWCFLETMLKKAGYRIVEIETPDKK